MWQSAGHLRGNVGRTMAAGVRPAKNYAPALPFGGRPAAGTVTLLSGFVPEVECNYFYVLSFVKEFNLTCKLRNVPRNNA